MAANPRIDDPAADNDPERAKESPMGEYNPAYSLDRDGLTSFVDLELHRLTATTSNAGTPEERQEYVYVFANHAGTPNECDHERPKRRHRIVRLLIVEKGVQLNAKVTDAAGHQLVYLTAEENRRIAKAAALERVLEIRRILGLAQIARDYQTQARSITTKYQTSKMPRTASDLARLFSTAAIEKIFAPISDAQGETVEAVFPEAIRPIYYLSLFLRQSPNAELKHHARRLLWLLDAYQEGFLQFVQLRAPLGYSNDEVHPDRTLVRHVVDKKERHHLVGTREWWKGLRIRDKAANFIGLHLPVVQVPIDAMAHSMHVQIVSSAGVRLMWVRVRGTRGRLRRRLLPFYSPRIDRIRRWAHTTGRWGRFLRVTAQWLTEHTTVGDSLAKRRAKSVRDREVLEPIFTRREGKYRRRTRNPTTYYHHLTKENVETLARWVDTKRSQTGTTEHLSIQCVMRESLSPLILSFLPVVLAVAARSAPFSRFVTPLIAASATSFVSYTLFTYEKPALRTMVGPRLVLAVVAWSLTLASLPFCPQGSVC